MRRALLLILASLALVAGSFLALALDAPFADDVATEVGVQAETVEATGVSCTWYKSGNTYYGACKKTDQAMNFQHRMVVVCNDGLGDYSREGPVRLTLQYSWNWSSVYGCQSGSVFRYAYVLWWRV